MNSRIIYSISAITFLLFIVLPFSCKQVHSKKETYGPATLQLISLLDKDSSLKSMVIKSIEKVKVINPNRNTNPAQSLDEYLAFISWAEQAMPWALLKKDDYPEIFDNMLQGICYFYFLHDQPMKELEGKGYFNNTLQYHEPFATWIHNFCITWGQFLDSEASWNDSYYQMALRDEKFGLQNGWYEDPSNWKTFNAFFARHLKSPDMRPIAAPEDESVVASFADSEPQGTWAIDSASNVISSKGVPVKSATIRSVKKLLGDGSAFKNEFANGTFTHSFLSVNDYHRFHFPLAGTIREVRIIPGINPTGALLFWDYENKRYAFDPSLVGWQSVETRGCVILETKDFGLVALLPIGMAMVGSVNFEPNVSVGTKVKKGDPLGYFLFGGSDFIMIFQEKTTFVLDAPKDEPTGFYNHVLTGERLGHLVKKK